MRFLFLALAFILIPIIELVLLIRIGVMIGPLATAALVVVMGIIGAYLAKRAGLHTLHEARLSMAEGKVPGDQIIDGLLIFAAGILLITPGILTDCVGFALLVPGIRTVARQYVKYKLYQMVSNGSVKYRIFRH